MYAVDLGIRAGQVAHATTAPAAAAATPAGAAKFVAAETVERVLTSSPYDAAVAGAQRILITASEPQAMFGAAMVHNALRRGGHTSLYLPQGDVAAGPHGMVRGLGKVDAVVVRSGAHLTDDAAEQLEMLRRAGVPILNPAPTVQRAGNKWSIAQGLAELGLPHPRTVHLRGGNHLQEDVAAALRAFGDGSEPVVIKPTADMGGKGVIFQETSSQVSMRSVADALLADPSRSDLVVQQWLKEGTGRDLRAYFVRSPDGQVLIPPRGLERFGGEGKGQANLSSGGTPSAHELTRQQRAVTGRAADHFGMDFGSVDFVLGPNGYNVIEVNTASGLEPTVLQLVGGPLDQQIADLAVASAKAGRVPRS